MDTYIYRCGQAEHRLPMSKYDAHLSVLLRCFPPWRAGVFATHKQGHIERIPRGDFLADAHLFFELLDRTGASLQYRYSLKILDASGDVASRGSGSFNGSFGGKSLIAKAGPGFCGLTDSKIIVLDNHAIEQLRATGEMRDYEAGRLSGLTCSAVLTTVVHDLRDMKPIVLDDGQAIHPERRSRHTDLPTRIRELVAFVSHAKGDSVEVGVQQSKRRE